MRALSSVVVAAALATGAVAMSPVAQAYVSTIHSIVYWSGPECISVEISRAPGGYGTEMGVACGGVSDRFYSAVAGQWVGADPVGLDSTLSLGCQLWVDGDLRVSDYAGPGDHHDVNCLRFLRSGSAA